MRTARRPHDPKAKLQPCRWHLSRHFQHEEISDLHAQCDEGRRSRVRNKAENLGRDSRIGRFLLHQTYQATCVHGLIWARNLSLDRPAYKGITYLAIQLCLDIELDEEDDTSR